MLATFTPHGSPVAGFQEVGSWHLAYLAPYSGPPDLLRHVAGFPGLGLLSGLRRHGARALEAISHFSDVVRPSVV